MAKVAGVDFSDAIKFRECATVKMPNGETLDLPLITVRDASTATLFLQRNDTLIAKYGIIASKIKTKSEALNEVRDKLIDDADAKVYDEGMDTLEDAINAINSMQKRLIGINAEHKELCDEIQEFLKPYLVNTDVITQLKEHEDLYTIKVLQLMLYGNSNKTEQDDEKENPTITPVQNI